jgi:hypothetical protein
VRIVARGFTGPMLALRCDSTLRSWFCCRSGEVAQLVEHTTENRSVDGSIPPLATIFNSFLNKYLSVNILRLY